MDILSKLPLIGQKDDETDDLTPEEIEAEARAERIRFHREKVRNGPTKFSFVTEGQQRRAKDRAIRGRQKKVRKAQVRAHFEKQQAIASLRGNLQAVGTLPYATKGFRPPASVVERARRALAATFGEEQTFEKALAAYNALIGKR